ncbi:MAG: hypothetical protein FWF12_00485 [Betaproteobacteria bacterium]|nr:hypothetical protein [Betaproteobacteria bacterium]
MKVLNLDKLNKQEGRQIVLFGKTHAIDGMTVDNFIKTTSVAEQLADEPSIAKQVEATVDLILRSAPTIDRADLLKLELEQLQAIVAFIKGEDVDGVESSEGNGEKK